MGIEPTTEGLLGGCKRSEWSGGVGFIRICKKACPVASDSSGGVGLVCGIFRGIFLMGTARRFMSEARREPSCTNGRLDVSCYAETGLKLHRGSIRSRRWGLAL